MTDAGETRRTRVGSFNVEIPESYTELSNADRCIMGFNAGPPITPGGYNQNMQLFQTPDHVVVVTEMVHTTRVIPVDGRASLDDNIRQWSGDSRGHWEGDTLVVETTNFDPKTNFRGARDTLRLTEWYTRVDDDTIDYRFTVDDPHTFTRPWTVSRPMTRITDRVSIFEYACHEGNYAMEGILGGARAAERAAPD